jgi:hypothetical protein
MMSPFCTSSGSITWYRVGSTHSGNSHDMPGDATPHRRSAQVDDETDYDEDVFDPGDYDDMDDAM